MAQPPPYDRSYNFHDYQAENPLKPLPADKLDEEFSRVKTTLDAVLQNLKLIQRDDTALANKSVGFDQLKDEIQLGFNPPTDWTANHNYIVRDTVFVDVSIYRCLVSHISSNDFEDDLNAGYWELVVDFASVQTAAIAARDAALQAQADAEAAQQAAEDARDDALLAQSGAESARDTAIGAKDDALLAKSGAESARDAAVVAQGLAEAAQADAEAARDDAISARNAAQAAQTDAENAADRAEAAASGVEYPVSYAPQTLNSEQQAQARANIGLGNSATRDAGTTGLAVLGAETAGEAQDAIKMKAATRAALKAFTPAAGDVAVLTESGRKGVFVFDASDLSTEVAADTLEGIYIAPNSDPTGAGGAWVRNYSGPVHISWFGAASDGTTDDSAAIQAAHDLLAHTLGGGEVDLGIGVIAFASTLYFGEGDAVLFRGHGRGTIINGKDNFRNSAATRMLWTGPASGDGIIWTSDRGDTGTKPRRHGGGMLDVMVDGGEIGGRGVQIISHNGTQLRIRTCYWTDVHFRTNVLANGLSNGPSDNQYFDWDIETGDVNTSNEPRAHIVLHGREADETTTGRAANTSIGRIRNLNINVEENAIAADFGNCDGIHVETLMAGRRRSSGDGGKVILHGSDSLTAETTTGNCRQIYFGFVQATQGIIAKAGSPSSAHSNVIGFLSRGNGAPLPTVEAGAELAWIRTGTDNTGGGAAPMGFAPLTTTVIRTTDITVAASSTVTMTWESELDDGANAWSSGSNITAPTWARKARISIQVAWGPSGQHQRRTSFVERSTDGGETWNYIHPLPYITEVPYGTLFHYSSSPWMPVNPGDLFRLRLGNNGTTDVDIDATYTFMAVEWG